MNCREFLERLDAYLDGEMADGERGGFLHHARDCSACREELRRAEALGEALRHLNDELRVPLPAQAAWRAAVRGESRRRKGRTAYRALSALAAAFVLLTGTTMMFRATGVLDFGDSVAVQALHTPTTAPRVESYAAQPAPAALRYAAVESDGALDDLPAKAVQPSMPADAAPADAESAAPKMASLPEGTAPQDIALDAGTAWERVFTRNAVREMESDTFDATRQAVIDLVAEYGATLIGDSVSGAVGARQAALAVDVPVGEMDAFLEALDFVGHVTYFENNQVDISANYYDAQGRIESLEAEKERLNALIPAANSAEEIAALEEKLEDVFAQIDILQGKLRGFTAQLDNVRVDVTLREGAQLAATVISGGEGTAGQGFARSLDAIGQFFSDMGVSLAVIAPFAGVGIALIGLVWLCVVLISRRRRHE